MKKTLSSWKGHMVHKAYKEFEKLAANVKDPDDAAILIK